LIKFSSPAEASAAVSKLHNHVFKGFRLSATIKKRVDKLVTGRKSGAPSRSSRLIIRNLPWHVTERDLHELFAPYGPIFSITLPTTQSDEPESKPGRHRGFAFVWMLSHADAEHALKGVNGRTVGAQKKQKKTRREREEAAREKAAARLRAMKGEEPEGNEDSEEEEKGDHADEPLKEGRVVAVDWALSKSKWEETVSQRQDEEMEIDGQGEEEEEEEEGGEEEGDKSRSEAGSSEEEVSEGSDEESEEELHERPQLPNTDVGTTLFVRNVPFEATEDDMRTLFRAFGPLRYARITMDHETGRSRGTGFVCFWKKEDADAAIEEAEAMARELGTDAGSSKIHNPFSMSLLTPDPSASLARRLVLHGRTLSAARAGGKKGRSTGVQQAKVVRAADRVDAVTGKGRSRGYGFIEMSEHADALRVLRWINNRPGVVGLMRGWWRDEVKDMAAALKTGPAKDEGRESRLKRLREELERLDAELGPEVNNAAKEPRGSNKTLMLEFAIENVQVVKRRNERTEAAKSGLPNTANNSKKRKAPDSTGDEPEVRPKKGRTGPKEPTPGKPKDKISSKKASSKAAPQSRGTNNVGAIIGRKRRDRRKAKGN
ncbi:RNA recognition motif-containing protein, partial [Ceratobasidium sp. 423]